MNNIIVIIKWLNRIIDIVVVGLTAVLPLGWLQLAAGSGEGTLQKIAALPAMLVSSPLVWILPVLYAALNIVPSAANRRLVRKRHRILADGAELLIIFLIAPFVSAAFIVACIVSGIFAALPGGEIAKGVALLVISVVAVYAILFWNGIIRIYTTSVQLGIRYRVWGIILGWVFPANLFMLGKMIRVVLAEVRVENGRILLNRGRQADGLCRTRYPLLMVHGVFFRDFKQGFLNYWGRIPDDLKENGAEVFYGGQQSAASVAECGRELAERIRDIVSQTGCGKVNIIAHSKGGLDARYAASQCGAADLVASITTINTPHRGCEFADYLLSKVPEKVKARVAAAYNAALRRLGDNDPDFLEAVGDLTHEACVRLNEEIPDAPGVYYQSFGSHMKKAGGGRFPLNFSFHLVKYFDGPNDGLVGEKSFAWGEHYEYLEPAGSRGISHGDTIDLNRENIDGFDVREFYVQLVHGLKERGL